MARGRHRHGAWSVAALTQAVADQADADRAAHRQSLRRGPRASILADGTIVFQAISLYFPGHESAASFVLTHPPGGYANIPALIEGTI